MLNTEMRDGWHVNANSKQIAELGNSVAEINSASVLFLGRGFSGFLRKVEEKIICMWFLAGIGEVREKRRVWRRSFRCRIERF